MSNKLPKSINLLEPITAPGDFMSGLYTWIFTVGKYLLVVVQVVVLAVFFSRFIFDKTNNDLTDNINDQVESLESPFFKQGEIRYNNLHSILSDIRLLQENQLQNAGQIGSVLSTIPSELLLEKFSYNEGSVTLNFKSTDPDAISKFERQLNANPLYEDVRVSITQKGTGSDIEFVVTFKFKPTDSIFEIQPVKKGTK